MKRPNEDLRRELEDLSPRLLKLKEQEEAFQIPENFFEQLQANVLAQIEPSSPAVAASRSPRLGFWQRLLDSIQMLTQPRWALSLATLTVLLISGGLWFFRANPGSSVSRELARVELATVDAYLQENAHEIDTETLLEFAARQGIQANFDDLNPEELQDYLDETIQEMDAETLNELL